MKLPSGFRFSGVACGIKPKKLDLALVVSDVDAACAGAFTINRAKAAPVVHPAARTSPLTSGRSLRDSCAAIDAAHTMPGYFTAG